MAESESHPYLASPGEGEVERLLREAESLTQEVAHATGAPPRDADALLSGEETSGPDPLGAVEAASSNIMSLEDLLGELGPAEVVDTEKSHPKRRTSPPPPVANPPDTAKPELPPRPPAANVTPGGNVESRRPEPRVEHMPADEAGAGPQSTTSSDEAAGKSDDSQKPPAGARTPRPPRKPLMPRLIVGGKMAVRGGRTVALLIFRDLPIGLLSFFDLPFRRTPRPIKNAIGIIGAITLGMGALAWALPELMRPSPISPPSGDSHAEAPAAGHSGGH